MSAPLSVIERKLLGKSAARCVRTAALLLAVQAPMWWSARTALGTSCTVPVRLSLLLDVGLSLTLVLAAIRISEYVRVADLDARWRLVYRAGAAGLTAAAGLNLAENLVLWLRFANVGLAACPDQTVAGLSQLWWLVAAGSAVALGAALARARRAMLDGGDPMRHVELQQDSDGPRPGTIIACSGGGIRSASFSLGALQALMKGGVYRGASAVVGVSGGGYMAAAFHLAGRSLTDEDEPPFAQGTPELALLRRNTRYLLPRGVEIFRGLMSVVYGVAVNIVNIGVALWALSWLLGWYLHEFRVLTEWGREIRFEPPGWWVLVAVTPWAAAVASFVLVEKVVDRFVQVADAWRRGSRTFTRVCLSAGSVTVLLMLVVPASLAWLSRQEGLDSVAGVLSALIMPAGDRMPTTVALLGGLAGALVGLGRIVLKGLGAAGERSSWVGRVVTVLRVKVAPWLGSLLIVVGAYVVLLRLTGDYATDAAFRSNWANAVWLAVTVLVVRLLTDANRTSLHHFYRERLSTAYLVDRVDRREAVTKPYRKPLMVSSFATPDHRPTGPELVMAAVANAADEEFVPTGRGCVPFIIDSDRTGIVGDRSLPPGGRAPTARYERFADYDGRDLTVPAAMAMSGAAVSPLAGRSSARTRPVRVLLTVLNARLGVWLPNPYGQPPRTVDRAERERAAYEAVGESGTRRPPARLLFWETAARFVSVLGKPGPYRLLREAFGRPSLYDRKLYVTDGGHYDNLGLLEALRRRPERVFVIDASNDAANTFAALADAIATARMDLGVEIRVDIRKLIAGDGKRAGRAWAFGKATYDDSEITTRIIYLKAQLVPGLTWDVEHYARQHADFPRRSTGDQFYDEWDFEAYRQLGYTLADRMLRDPALAKTVPGKTAPDKTAPDKTAPDKTRLGQPGLDKTALEKTGLDKTGLDKAGLDKAGLDKAGLDKAGLDKAGLDKAGLDKRGAPATRRAPT